MIYVSLGFLTLGLGVIGIILPVLPTTPFLLLTLYFFSKGSDKFHQWFINTKLYHKYLKRFAEERSMTRKQKWSLMIFVDCILLTTIIITNQPIVTIILIIIAAIKYLYFFTQVKTI
ncbi:MAG: YbaN family protein [Tenericutes bacterium]|nr:YbaN family protein [Mycoplasmatota bacterium]